MSGLHFESFVGCVRFKKVYFVIVVSRFFVLRLLGVHLDVLDSENVYFARCIETNAFAKVGIQLMTGSIINDFV